MRRLWGVLVLCTCLLVHLHVVGSARASKKTVNSLLEEAKSIEICANLSPVHTYSTFGNVTRHHKKGHRKKSTTSTTTTPEPTEPPSTTTESIFESQRRQLAEAIQKRRSRISRSSPLNVEEIFQTSYKDRGLSEYHAHKGKYERVSYTKLGEAVEEIIEEGYPETIIRVKKNYRDTSFNGANKVSGKGSKIFVTDNCTSVVVQIGTTAILHCEVSDITENTVTWIRRRDYSLMSVGLVTYSADKRILSAHGRHIKDWALHIKFAAPSDGGFYECQVPTHPPTSIFFRLILVAAYADIVGEEEKIIHSGSMLRLVCMIRRATEPPTYVFWYFGGRMVNYDTADVEVQYGKQSSELVIKKANVQHAGNYTCTPSNAKPASVIVHVVQSETPAAMQHGNNSGTEVHHLSVYIIIALTKIFMT